MDYNNVSRGKIAKVQPEPAIEPAKPVESVTPNKLLEQLEQKQEQIIHDIRDIEKIKHDACKQLDILRNLRAEHHVAITALKRSEEITKTETKAGINNDSHQ